MPSREQLMAIWLAQRGHLFPWAPVALALGIGVYFSLGAEPSFGAYATLALLVLLLALAALRAGVGAGPLLIFAALTGAGLMLAATRAHLMEGPVLNWRYYGPVEGRIVAIDRSGSDAVRLTLDRVILKNVPPVKTPDRVRVSLHGSWETLTPEPGLRVMMTAHLAPPGGPVEPGGFDFQRHAWFLGIGAVGYTRTPVLALEEADGALWLSRLRMAFSARIQAAIPGQTGAFAAAIMTGDRAGVSTETLQALRVSNLAHLLAISGLHMGLLAGFVFAALRIGIAMIPFLCLRLPAKKIAAIGALCFAAGYLALSGGNVATERAFVMAAVVLIAVIFDRRALSLRAVALAAMIVLVLRPEALLGPGFQMSFAATTALVAVFGWMRDGEVSLGPAWAKPALAVVLSSLTAGLATAPFAAAHFNQIAHFGLIANLLSVPLMGVLVIPAAVVAVLLMPLGLEASALWVMDITLRWILGVAHWVSTLDGARGTVLSPDGAVLPLLSLSALFVILCQGRLRFAGLLPLGLSFLLWSQTERPVVLISETGALVGVLTDQGRGLSRARGGGFIATNWLENDGDPTTQQDAALRWEQAVAATDIPIVVLRGKRAAEGLTDCEKKQWVILNADPATDLPCTIISPQTLKKTGALALYSTDKGFRTVTARQIAGQRLWNAY